MGEQDVRLGDKVASLPISITANLAGINQPDQQGALGRNKKTYIHVRFQMGVHHLANYALAAKTPDALEKFVRAIEYAFAHQTDQGDFEFVMPASLAKQHALNEADRASATAFFLSSSVYGLYAIRTSTWAQQTPELRPLITRLTQIERKLPSSLAYLSRQRAILERADQQAPNRLLINALAFVALGKILGNQEAVDLGRHFSNLASQQIHASGYFIEGGGYDSSYNGVSTATAFRLAALEPSDSLRTSAERAMAWQVTRITPEGEIMMDGNTRVHTNGETFFGQRKTMDVPHTLEALAWSSIGSGGPKHEALATKVYTFYKQKAEKR